MSNVNRRFPLAHALNQLLRALLPVAALVIAARTASAQQGGIVEGSRVQISVPGAKNVTGIVKSRSADSTSIFVDGNGGVRRFSNSDITSLRVSGGRRAVDGIKRGAVWGAGVGVILAGLVYATPEDKNDYEYTNYDKNRAAVAMVTGSVFWGVVIGAIAKAEHWDSVPVRPSVAASSGRVGLSFAFSPSLLH